MKDMISGTQITDLIQMYLKGEATQQQKDELELWVAANAENREKFQRIKNVWDAEHPCFGESDVLRTKSDAWAMVQKRIHSGRLSFGSIWKNAAAVLVLPLAAISIWLVLRNRELASGDNAVCQSVRAAYGSVSSIQLPDGSIVYLNSGSELSYVIDPDNRERQIHLCGEAYFEVVSDTRHPFTVSTASAKIIATGTRFNVEAYPESDSRITLVEGVVDIVRGEESYRLPKGWQMILGKDGSTSSSMTDTFKWTAWKDGIIAFRGDRLSYVFEKLAHIYNAEIIIDEEEVADLQIRATFQEERLDEIMSLLEQCSPIVCRKQEKRTDDGLLKEYHLSMKK